jgi:hypothetical protein
MTIDERSERGGGSGFEQLAALHDFLSRIVL